MMMNMLLLRSSIISQQCQRIIKRINPTIINQKYYTTLNNDNWRLNTYTYKNYHPINNTNFQINKRSLFIQTETTPNPESLKFYPGEPVLQTHPDEEITNGFYVTHQEKSEISRSPLAKELFKIEGIKGVYLGANYITITKFATTHWNHVRPYIFSSIMDFYGSGKPVLLSTPEVTDTTILDDDDEVVAMIKEILEVKIRPAVQEDGGDIHYDGFDEGTGIVTVKLAGACSGCPSSSATLKNGVENMLMHYIPEVMGVEALDEEEEEGGGDVEVTESKSEDKKMKTYEERLAAAGIPFSD